jgi:hypothetical protein
MTDLVITNTDVDKIGGSQRTAEAGVAIAAGESVYIDTAGLAQLCEKGASAVEAAFAGIALNDAGVAQPVTYQAAGSIDLGSVIAAGVIYVCGAAAGGIAPSADIGTGNFVTIIGVGLNGTDLQIGVNQSGVAAA